MQERERVESWFRVVNASAQSIRNYYVHCLLNCACATMHTHTHTNVQIQRKHFGHEWAALCKCSRNFSVNRTTLNSHADAHTRNTRVRQSRDCQMGEYTQRDDGERVRMRERIFVAISAPSLRCRYGCRCDVNDIARPFMMCSYFAPLAH